MKKIILLLIITLSAFLYGQAQSMLYIEEKNGAQTSFILTDIRKLTLPAGNMIIHKTAGSSTTYVLNNIHYLHFNNSIVKVNNANEQRIKNFTLSPNPVNDELLLNYHSLNNIQINIVDMQGKLVYQQEINDQREINQIVINVSQLSKGLYVCRLNNGITVITNKFLKIK